MNDDGFSSPDAIPRGHLKIDIRQIYSQAQAIPSSLLISTDFTRSEGTLHASAHIIIDRFAKSRAKAAFIRIQAPPSGKATIGIEGGYDLIACVAGGWLLHPIDSSLDTYWIPHPLQLRRLDQDAHILSHAPAQATGFAVSPIHLALEIEIPEEQVGDFTVWSLPASEPDLIASLQTLHHLETQSYFMWSSHTLYKRPADLYLHLVYGLLYENHEVWPKYWRVCSELDAWALYCILNGLQLATGKRLYNLLKQQVVYSVIARQSEDGGWYHGEWTDHMESHFRLHSGALHLLAAYYEEAREPIVLTALEKAAAFAAFHTDDLAFGKWYLHDSLEADEESLKRYPFRYTVSRALGKSPSNLLVLNTHLDTNIAMERIQRVTGNKRHESLIASARRTTHSIVNQRPAEWIYRFLNRVIGLSLLPSKQAAALPMHLRAIKRIGWKYLAPQMPRIKALFPRLVMPGGFIERGLAQEGLSVRYQPVNLMDLTRTRRLFEEEYLDSFLAESFAFTRTSGLKDRWKEKKGKEDDALGFWAEALYHLCLIKPDPLYRNWLAEAIMDCVDNQLGLSPSLLGGNNEAVPPADQIPCPSPNNANLRVANLSQGAQIEVLVVNATDTPVPLSWETPPPTNIAWESQDGTIVPNTGSPPIVSPRGWLCGILRG